MLRTLLATLSLLVILLAAPTLRAQTPASDLMAKLGVYAERFETMRKNASYVVEGKLDSLDGSGRTESTKFMRARVDSDGHTTQFSVLQYLEDGQDKTAEAKDKQKKREADAKNDPPSHKRAWRMPFHPGEQPRYYFNQVEVDAQNPSRVRIAFVPKIVEDDTIEGSAWVDVRAGTIVTTGFKLSKPPSIIDSVHVTMMFGESTSLGPAPSRIAVDAHGGVLFLRKHYHGEATLSQYRIAP